MAENRYNFANLNILVADNNRQMRSVIVDVLRGFRVGRVVDVDDSAKAFMELRTLPIDIILVDWMLSPIDGREFTKLVRTAPDSVNHFIPIIMVTGHTERHRVIGARDAGVTEFLAKPVSPIALFRRLVSVIERPRPYIREHGYFGPDRRRHDSSLYEGLKRRANDAPAKADSASVLTNEEVKALFQPAEE